MPSAATGAAAKADTPTGNTTTDQPSIILVEFLGFGDGYGSNKENEKPQRKPNDQRSYNTNSPYQILGVGTLDDREISALAAEMRIESRPPR
jgi:hypothetical protein